MEYLHTMVRVTDLEASLDFYCNRLGLVEVSRYDNEAGRFTLIFLSATGDVEKSKANRSPTIELTYNWDPEAYTGGRNFGHLAYEVENIYALCQKLSDGGVTINRPPPRRPHGLRPLPRRHLVRVAAKGRELGACRAVAVYAECWGLVRGASPSPGPAATDFTERPHFREAHPK